MTSEAAFVAYPSTPAFAPFRKSVYRNSQESRPEVLASPEFQRIPTRGKFFGTVKLHGTNATVVFLNGNSSTAHAQIQSRSRVIDAKTDNGGTVAHLSRAPLADLVAQILTAAGRKPGEFRELMVAGEMAGQGIQKGVAIAYMPRFFAIFNIRIDGEWVDMRRYKDVALPAYRIFNVAAWPTYEIDIDLVGETKEVVARMNELTDDVVKACPVGAALAHEVQAIKAGQQIIWAGEGIVWTMVESLEDGVPLSRKELLNFKTKGEAFKTTAHAPSLARDADAVARAAAFAQYALAERRFEQGIEYLEQELVQDGKAGDSPYQMQLFSKFVSWVLADALTEEKDKMEEMEADPKLAKSALFEKTKEWFMAKVKANGG
ncbi:hypothetical protein EXIGLDRAFT_771768 [Exidia glandulosa HHB12029]|uniref:RNA ligase domain-containing protein n=1 Tax=Exidia glandulosa HHB12029 TaxID=1314781 RepID=A0A165FRK1_EXIGL|nr:hypothetical protein EXIGLDRAFT_771768 [Exidia glandulosa HHB12029]